MRSAKHELLVLCSVSLAGMNEEQWKILRHAQACSFKACQFVVSILLMSNGKSDGASKCTIIAFQPRCMALTHAEIRIPSVLASG